MTAVAAGPDRFVAVGRTPFSDQEPTGIAWTSTDGRTWVRSGDALAPGWPAGVIWDGTRYVAFGGGESIAEPAVWTSSDGTTWERGSGIQDVTTMFVVRLGHELIALGGTWGDGGEGGANPNHQLSAWTSTDGLSWQPIANPALPSLSGLGGMTAANGMLVAWGAVDTDSVGQAVTLRSTDGRTWEQATVGKAEDSVHDIVGGHGPMVAVGSGPYCCEEGATAPVKAWTSEDGSAWKGAQFQPLPGSDELQHVVWSGSQYVALGTDVGDPISWLSVTGSVWSEANSVPDAAADNRNDCTGGPCPAIVVTGLTAGSAGLVAVGQWEVRDADGNRLGWRSVVWIAP